MALRPADHGYFDVRPGCPAGGVLVGALPCHEEDLQAAGIVYGRALRGFERNRRWRPLYRGWVIEKDWEAKLEAAAEVLAVARERRKRAAAAWRKWVAAQEAAEAAAAQRELERLSTSAYGRLLLALRAAQGASDRAKSRTAKGLRRKEHDDSAPTRRRPSRRSRQARENDYVQKRVGIAAACAAATEAGVLFGWKEQGGRIPWVVFFELRTGQVSFHSEQRGAGPDYPGQWDGRKGQSRGRIERAVRHWLGQQPCGGEGASGPGSLGRSGCSDLQ